VFGVGFDGVVHGWFATFIYVGLRNSRRAARALADAEVERSEAQRSLLAAQLLAAQSQVDPEFVMRTLEGIERIYEKEPAAADAQLDELIAFLRDAIPRLRSDERRTLRDPLKDPQGDER
jgi:LytS/YehU family sensor histidine kinase